MVRLAVVSDSHLSAREAVANANWDTILAHLERSQPDIVVHAGDISLDGANDEADLTHARAQLDRVPVPWLAVPGNHDLGEPSNAAEAVIEARRQAYESVFGDRFWTTTVDGWRLVGLDSQQFMDPESATEAWWQWTAAQLDTDQPTVVFQHRPLTPTAVGEIDTPLRYLTEPARSRLKAMLARPNVRLVVSGHVHQWRSVTIDATLHVWAPSTWATLPDRIQPVIGTKVVGLLDITLGDEVTAHPITPADTNQAIIGETIPMPYGH